MNKSLGVIAVSEIRESVARVAASDMKATAVRLAKLYGCSWQHIYRITADLRPPRKSRADRGRRVFTVAENTDLWTAMQLVVHDKLDPQQALETCRLRGAEKLPSLEYFQKILRDHGLGRKARHASRRAFRRWEAAAPGEIFQIDVTALKVRWQDEKTRRILRIEGIDKNHPNTDATKLRVWQIMLVDDYSRRRFLRYIATTHITSREMVRFECEAYDMLGIPKVLYTDNGSEFKGHHIKAARILNAVLATEGGYRHQTHAPGNSQASGKVEVAHKWAEQADRFVGLAVTEGQEVTLEKLNAFADSVCLAYNQRVHRSTSQTPLERWFGRRVVVRKLPSEIVESALLSDEFDAVLDPSMTISYKGAAYKIPAVQPFVNFVGQKIKIVLPPAIDLMIVTLPDRSEFEIEKILASADRAGEFKRPADSVAQDLTKRLRQSRKAEIKRLRQQSRLTGEIAPIPYFNVEPPQPASNVTQFPQPEYLVSADDIAAVTTVPDSLTYDTRLSYWDAVATFGDEFETVDHCKEFLTKIFADPTVSVPKALVESALADRHRPPAQKILRAI